MKEIINLETYPINNTGSIKYRELINYTRKQLNEDSCCVLSNFIKSDSIQILEIQREGKNKQTTKDFLLGKKISKGVILT